MKGKVSEWMRKRRIIIASLTWLKYSQIFGWIVSHKNTRIPEEKNSSGHDQLQCLFGANHYLFRFNSAHHFDRVIHQKCRKRIKRLKNTSRKTSMQIIVNVRILFSQKLFSWYIHTWFILKGTYSYIHFFFFSYFQRNLLSTHNINENIWFTCNLQRISRIQIFSHVTASPLNALIRNPCAFIAFKMSKFKLVILTNFSSLACVAQLPQSFHRVKQTKMPFVFDEKKTIWKIWFLQIWPVLRERKQRNRNSNLFCELQEFIVSFSSIKLLTTSNCAIK